MAARCFFYLHHLTDGIIHTTAFLTPVMEHWLECDIAHISGRSITEFPSDQDRPRFIPLI